MFANDGHNWWWSWLMIYDNSWWCIYHSVWWSVMVVDGSWSIMVTDLIGSWFVITMVDYWWLIHDDDWWWWSWMKIGWLVGWLVGGMVGWLVDRSIDRSIDWLIDCDNKLSWWRHQTFPPLWGEFNGHRWIPLTKASGAEIWCFLWSAPEQTGWVNNRDADDLRWRTSLYCDISWSWICIDYDDDACRKCDVDCGNDVN